MTLSDGFAPTYNVELLCETTPVVRKRPLFEAIRRYCPNAEPLDREPDHGLLAFAHPDHMVRFTDGELPAQTLIAVAEKAPDVSKLQPAVQQSWSFPDAQHVVGRATASVLVSDVMSSHLDCRERVWLFLNVLRGVLDVVPAVGIHWVPSAQVTDPAEFRKASSAAPAQQFFAGPMNVRFFNIENSSEDKLMDTLGLAAIGLPDLQCHFRGLDPGEVSRTLCNTAYYLFEEGDVIENGHTVEGIAPGSMWSCQHENALVPPNRVVLDLNPGAPFAAGNRA